MLAPRGISNLIVTLFHDIGQRYLETPHTANSGEYESLGRWSIDVVSINAGEEFGWLCFIVMAVIKGSATPR